MAGRLDASRFINHCWFFMACCGFVVISSLPRFITIADAIISLLLYMTFVRRSDGDLGVGDFIADDLGNYSFARSSGDTVIIACIRSALLFYMFAYRFHTSRSTFYVSTSVMLFSTVFTSLKIILNQNPSTVVLLGFSFLVALGEYGVYMAVRRRRIVIPLSQRLRTGGPSQAWKRLRRGRDGQNASVQDPGYERLDVHQNRTSRATSTDEETGERSALRSSETRSSSSSLVVPDDESEFLEPSALADKDSKFLQIDSLEVHYKLLRKDDIEGGDRGASGGGMGKGDCDEDGGERPTIVLLHGFGGSVSSWDRVWAGLANLGYPLLAFDRPGFGLTSRPVSVGGGKYPSFVQDGRSCEQENPYSTAYSEHLTLKMMDTLGIRRAIYIGHSTGGSVALQVALRAPNRAAGLLLVSPTVYSEGFPALVRSMFRTKIGKSVVKQLVRSEIGEVAIRRAWYNSKHVPASVMIRFKNVMRLRNWDAALVEMASVKHDDTAAQRLAEVVVPVTIIHGMEDKLVPLSESERATTVLGAKLVSIEHCGHVPHEEFPQVFLAQATAFLRDL